MNSRTIGSWCAVTALFVLAAPSSPTSTVDPSGVRVGVFDSRALVVAYAASDLFEQELESLRRERERCEAAGDAHRVRTLDAEARERQARFHRQAFSTAPVDDVLAVIADTIPGIAERAGVDLIVSKWRIAYRRPTAELVDVTELLIEPFEPSAHTLRTVRDLQRHDPLALYATDWTAVEQH